MKQLILLYRKRDTHFSNKLCARNNKEYVDISSRGKGIFVDTCAHEQNK